MKRKYFIGFCLILLLIVTSCATSRYQYYHFYGHQKHHKLVNIKK